ncbi:glycosyl hydrolase [Adhaeribacter pallidiroseus]|uniref:Mannan endo-1,4-beta-mannosidase n=1 Tax=Adhaeribacter pallidiroseus TaxID=2072847 RepID=A0A369QAU8_9BACT|nr:glycosyl hydrolase [Adhaeribacter pallidiroseus]RDC61824.1 Mannan endo-1,4-beta-mannosidase [Adhaeribacter pallidiroseus]
MEKFYPYLLCVFVLVLFSAPVYAQKYEAENATLADGATKQACATCSGGFYVAQTEGNLLFTITLPKEGFFNIAIHAASTGGSKINTFSLDDNTLNFALSQTTYSTLKLVGAQKLTAGQHQIKILKSWGWINIDYLQLEEVSANNRFNLNQTLVTANPTPTAKSLYDFLLDNYGDKIISGVMTLNSLDEATWLKQNTGKEPALLGIDLMHSGRGYTWYNDKQPVIDAKTWYTRNGIPALMWHWRDPSRKTEEFYVKNQSKPEGTDFDISKVSDVNSVEYKAMLADIDYTAGLLKELQDQNVPVIWRPLHEAAGGWFWWGAKGGAPLKTLWRLMYDRMVNYHGLRNLIWVWTREPNDDDWYPGDEYVDIVGRDIYKDGDHGSQTLEFSDLNSRYGGKKMITLSEAGSFPDVDNLVKDGAAWSWYMPWYGSYTRNNRYNSLDLWKKMFAHAYVITLDEMPDLKNYVRQEQIVTGIFKKLPKPLSFKAYPTLIQDKLFIQSEKPMETLAIYNLLGACVREEKLNGKQAWVSFAGINSGMYLVVINHNESIKVWKK